MSTTASPENHSPASENPLQSPVSDKSWSASPPDRALELAIDENDLEALRQALRDGANPNYGRYRPAFSWVTTREMITLLHENGARVDRLKMSEHARPLLVGTLEDLSDDTETKIDPFDCITEAQFQEGRDRHFGTANPEKMNIPLWQNMVMAGTGAFALRKKFLSKPTTDPDQEEGEIDTEYFYSGDSVWCFDRFGHSLTKLPDGTFVQIGGEHDDYYDPDFMIYNDVVVHHADSTPNNPKFDIYGYPENVFRPTDFHSATYVPKHHAIYIIGNNGHKKEEDKAFIESGETPVYRLDTGTWSITRVTTQGDGPGSIYHHCAVLIGDQILIHPDKDSYKDPESDTYRAYRSIIKDGSPDRVEIGVNEEWSLSLDDLTWKYRIQN